MSVAFGLLKEQVLVEWILAEGVNVRLNLQQHKYIWSPRQREFLSTNIDFLNRLSRVECHDSTYRAKSPALVFKSATGSKIIDVEGNTYIDLCAGFGVLAFGHNSQMQKSVFAELNSDCPPIVHGMGDVYASKDKVELLEAMRSILQTPRKGALAISGGQAVELTVKTSLLSGKSKIISFQGSTMVLIWVFASNISKRFQVTF